MSVRQSSRNKALVSVVARMSVGEIQGSSPKEFFMGRRGDGVPIILEETRELCGKFPLYQVIDESEVLLMIPAVSQEFNSASSIISVRSIGNPIGGVNLLFIYPNKTWVQATTDDKGEAEVHLHTTDLPMEVFVAAPKYAAQMESSWIPSQWSLAFNLDYLFNGGSEIFTESTGHLRGLNGRINSIRDIHDRIYLYASNVAINDGKRQSVHFFLGEKLRLTDANRKELWVSIIKIIGWSALIEYSDIG